jgi:hypothetical protein
LGGVVRESFTKNLTDLMLKCKNTHGKNDSLGN